MIFLARSSAHKELPQEGGCHEGGLLRRQRRSPDGIQASRAGRPNSGVAAEGARLLWCSVARPGPPRRCEPSCGAQVLPEDVLVMGSDGLFDNVAEDEILDIVVKVRYWLPGR